MVQMVNLYQNDALITVYFLERLNIESYTQHLTQILDCLD